MFKYQINLLRRGSSRVISALVVCAVLSGCTVLDKIDRGAYNIHHSVTTEDHITGGRSIGFTSRSDQIKKGNAAMDEIISQYSYLNEQVDRYAYARLQRIFRRVHKVSHYAHENWQAVLLPENSFNAFVTGGTYIAVHKGLLDEVKDDAGVAAVIGHELGHVVANHIFEKESLLFHAIQQDKLGGGFDFAYNTLKEEESDKIGVIYAALAGYDPRAISTVWEQISQRDDWSYFRTHPANSDRARATRILGERAQQYYISGKVNPKYAKLVRCNDLWCNE